MVSGFQTKECPGILALAVRDTVRVDKSHHPMGRNFGLDEQLAQLGFCSLSKWNHVVKWYRTTVVGSLPFYLPCHLRAMHPRLHAHARGGREHACRTGYPAASTHSRWRSSYIHCDQSIATEPSGSCSARPPSLAHVSNPEGIDGGTLPPALLSHGGGPAGQREQQPTTSRRRRPAAVPILQTSSELFSA
jgi:hypothetical protein